MIKILYAIYIFFLLFISPNLFMLFFLVLSMNHEKFIAIRDYFARIDEERKRTQTFSGWTGVGMFVPSSLTHLYAGFQHLINTGAIDQQGLLLDAGCGDGRVLALLAGVFNIPC